MRKSGGRLAQLVRAIRLHRIGQGFESLSAHCYKLQQNSESSASVWRSSFLLQGEPITSPEGTSCNPQRQPATDAGILRMPTSRAASGSRYFEDEHSALPHHAANRWRDQKRFVILTTSRSTSAHAGPSCLHGAHPERLMPRSQRTAAHSRCAAAASRSSPNVWVILARLGSFETSESAEATRAAFRPKYCYNSLDFG
jgi:hypothetical protein